MPQTPDLSRFFDAGVEFISLTRTQARDRARELVAQGQLAQGQVQGFVDELMDESRRRTDLVVDVVRSEIQRQVKVLGIATKDDLARLEAKLAKYQARSAPKESPKKADAKKSGAKKSKTKQSGSKKSGSKKSGGKKSDANKSGSKNADAKASDAGQPAQSGPGTTADSAVASGTVTPAT
jgi:polyhydroxyalkanoate synthesis regulator phasin